jgi:hypothetical protein
MSLNRGRKGITKREVMVSRGENKQTKGHFLAYRMVQDSTLLVKPDAKKEKPHSLV